jgi:hypothetical protein
VFLADVFLAVIVVGVLAIDDLVVHAVDSH